MTWRRTAMPQTYRVEREITAPGQEVPLYRVIVRIEKQDSRVVWGTVQAGLTRPEAEALCSTLLDNECAKRRRGRIAFRTGKPGNKEKRERHEST